MRSICKPLLVVAFLGTVVAVPAFAQPASYPPACDASKVSKADVDRAHAVYLSGKQFLDESNYDKAISYFTDAYSIDCSVHAILPIIATAYERKGDKGEAVRALEEYLRRVPNAADREHVERRIKNLNDQLAHEAPPAPAASTSSATAASAAPAPTAPPEASAAPLAPPTSAVSAGPPEQPSGAGASAGPWVVAGIGGAAVIGGVVMYIVGSGDVSSAQNACPLRKDCAEAVASQGNQGRTLETVGVVVGSVGIGAVVAGLLWYHFDKPDNPGGVGAAAGGTFVSPVVAPGYAGLVLGSSL
jgi:tetratricopeptide (TPR) repeat protein